MESRGIALSDAVANLLREYAKETFVTQEMIAARTGISQSHVSKLFRLESKMTIAHLDAISRALGLSPVAVLAEADKNVP